MPHIGYFPVPAFPKPLNIGPGDMIPTLDTGDWDDSPEQIKSRTTLTNQMWLAPILLPHGATCTKATLHGNKTDALALMRVTLYRFDRDTGFVNSIQLVADWTDGYGTIEATAFNYPVIDNINYCYELLLELQMNDSVEDAWFTCFVLEWQ